MVNKLIKKIDNLINQITITFFVMFLIFGAYALFDAYTVKNTAKLSSQVLMLKPDENSEEQFSLKPLQEINPDICAWIKIEGTSIDYPIVIGKDNTEYLNRDYKKEYATAGSIFLDYRNERNFVDDYSIMYGHNMKKDLMFSDIKKFENAEFFENHKYGILYTELETYKVEIFAVAKVNAFSNDVYNLVVNKNGRNKDLISTYNASASFKRQLEFTDNDKLIVLSTCSAGGSNDRLVLVARIVKFNGDEDRLLISKSAEKSLEELENKNTNKQEETFKPYENKDGNNKKKFNINIFALPRRTLLMIILLIIIAIIFIILIIQRIKIFFKRRKKQKNGIQVENKEVRNIVETIVIKRKQPKKKKLNIFASLKAKVLGLKDKIQAKLKTKKDSKKENKPEKKVAEKKTAKNNGKKKEAKKEKVNMFASLKAKVLGLKDKIQAKFKARKENEPEKKVTEKKIAGNKITKNNGKKKEVKKEKTNIFEGIKVKLMGLVANVKALDLKGKLIKKETPKKTVKVQGNKESKKDTKVATKATGTKNTGTKSTENNKKKANSKVTNTTNTKKTSSKTVKTEAKKPSQKKTASSTSTKTQGSKKKTSNNKK